MREAHPTINAPAHPPQKKVRKRFFFEKKKQKTFAPAGFGTIRAKSHSKQKFFCFFFFKKRSPCFRLNRPPHRLSSQPPKVYSQSP
jgi:hypothetical protein